MCPILGKRDSVFPKSKKKQKQKQTNIFQIQQSKEASTLIYKHTIIGGLNWHDVMFLCLIHIDTTFLKAF